MRQLPRGFHKDKLPQGGQAGLAAAFEQGLADMVLELPQHHGHRRWRARQDIGGIGKVALFGHGAETAKHFDLDRHFSDPLKSDAFWSSVA